MSTYDLGRRLAPPSKSALRILPSDSSEEEEEDPEEAPSRRSDTFREMSETNWSSEGSRSHPVDSSTGPVPPPTPPPPQSLSLSHIRERQQRFALEKKRQLEEEEAVAQEEERLAEEKRRLAQQDPAQRDSHSVSLAAAVREAGHCDWIPTFVGLVATEPFADTGQRRPRRSKSSLHGGPSLGAGILEQQGTLVQEKTHKWDGKPLTGPVWVSDHFGVVCILERVKVVPRSKTNA